MGTPLLFEFWRLMARTCPWGLCGRLSATVYRSSKLRLFPNAEAAL